MKHIPLTFALTILWASSCWAMSPAFLAVVTSGGAVAVCDDGLLSNGCFDDGTTSWVRTYGEANTMSVSGGVLSYTENEYSYEGVKQAVALDNGASYTLTFDVVALDGSFYTYIGDTQCGTISATGTGQSSTCAAGSIDEIKFIAAGIPIKSISIDNVKLIKN